MLSNRLAFAALAVACLGAAAGGGYLASRQNTVPAVANSVSTPAPLGPSDQAGSASTAAPVQETETIVGEAAPKPSSSAVPAEAEAPSVPASPKRADTIARQGPKTPTRSARPAATNAKAAEPLPTLERTWPSGAVVSTPSAPPSPAPPAASPSIDTPAPRTEERIAQEVPRAPEVPLTTSDELVVSADSVIGLEAETSLTSDSARVEDRVEARVTRDVRVGDMVAIPAGARAMGSVVSVERGGKFRERARLGIRFNTLVLADGTRLPISTETFYREGEAPGRESASKIGGATVGGAILGAILGGAKGAAIGATAGAGAGTAAVMAGDRNTVTFRSGQTFTVRLLSPVTVTIERK